MATKRTIGKTDVERMLSNYDVGVIESVDRLTKGSVQINMLLQTQQGKFVLRYYQQARSFKSVLFEVNLIKYLRAKNYPCPAVLRNIQGKLAGLYKDRPFAVFEFAHGVHVENPSTLQKRQLIQRVAELQNLTRKYRSVYAKYRWNYGVELCEKLARDTADTLATTNSKEKLKWYLHELSELVLPSSLPKGICHADYDYTNVLFKGNRFHALIDFDDANYTFLSFDLASLIAPVLFTFRWDTWRSVRPGDKGVDFAEARKMVSAYQRYRTLSAIEKKYFFDVQKLVVFLDCLWFFRRGKANDFMERRKIEYLNALGRESFCQELFG